MDRSNAGNHCLIIGGARSGKSSFALKLAQGLFLDKTSSEALGLFIATAVPGDEEMTKRIEAHKIERGNFWRTEEEQIHIAKSIERHAGDFQVILIDCLTMWISNLLLHQSKNIDREIKFLEEVLFTCPTPIIMVSNEVGLGIVPGNGLSRRFRDISGSVNQKFAAICQRVIFMVAGLPLVLKGELPPDL